MNGGTQTRPDTMLTVEGLSVGIKQNKSYLYAVRDISFAIPKGEIAGIVGESGCGKSLTALSIPRLLPSAAAVTSGTITLGGQQLLDLSPKDMNKIRGKEVSMIFQDPVLSLNPLVKIGNQIAESLKIHGEEDKIAIRNEVLTTMQKLGFEEPHKLLDLYPHQLSGGMCQRVMIALAIIGQPRLLIADEPTTSLDVSTQAQILELLSIINRIFGTTILFISHNLNVIHQLCHRVIVMYAGKIVEWGSIDQVYFHPAHEYTRGLLGSIPSRELKGKPLQHIPGKVPSIEEEFAGCPFAPRCAKAQGRCFTAFPQEQKTGEDHGVFCYYAQGVE